MSEGVDYKTLVEVLQKGNDELRNENHKLRNENHILRVNIEAFVKSNVKLQNKNSQITEKLALIEYIFPGIFEHAVSRKAMEGLPINLVEPMRDEYEEEEDEAEQEEPKEEPKEEEPEQEEPKEEEQPKQEEPKRPKKLRKWIFCQYLLEIDPTKKYYNTFRNKWAKVIKNAMNYGENFQKKAEELNRRSIRDLRQMYSEIRKVDDKLQSQEISEVLSYLSYIIAHQK